MKTYNKAGFSLIELLVALSILAVVAAIIVPRFLNVRTQAAATTTEAQRKIVEHACQQFLSLGGTLSAAMGDNFAVMTQTSASGVARNTIGSCKDSGGNFGSNTISLQIVPQGGYSTSSTANPGFYFDAAAGGLASYCDGAGNVWSITINATDGNVAMTALAGSSVGAGKILGSVL